MATTLKQVCRDRSLLPSILDGLRSDHRYSPPLLLWDEIGLSLFDAVLEAPDYYPSAREWSLLRNVVLKIADKISTGDRIVELGAGNMKKTGLLLRALQNQQKHVHYIGSDVDAVALQRRLQELRAVFPKSTSTIKIQGFPGTYEDCASWLKYNRDRQNCHTFLMWLGNSIANFTPHEASAYLREFLGEGVSMIIGIDGCENQQEISRSYEGGCNRNFVLNGLLHANQLLEAEAFDVDDWEIVGRWNVKLLMHESFYVARKNLMVNIEGERFCFRKGDSMMSIRSGKWPKQKVVEICEDASGRVIESWMNVTKSYGIYWVGKE